MLYTCVDIGSHSIKIIVLKYVNEKFYIMASTNVRSKGIKKGLVKDKELVIDSIKEAISNINSELGIEIKKVFLTFPLFMVNTSIEVSDLEVEGTITNVECRELIKKTVSENVPDDLEVLYLEPIVYEVDTEFQVQNPVGLTGNHLKLRCAISTIPKKYLYDYLMLFHELNIEVVDLTYGLVGDYYQNNNIDISKKLGVIVNFGYGKTEIGIFNKGILLKGVVLSVGSKKIDKDISYIYKVNKDDAVMLKEKFGVAYSSYADINNYLEITNENGENLSINQVEISQVIEARLKDIIKSVKNEINNLTNREIGYIIINGGITNLVGFPYLIESEFSIENIVTNVLETGIRNNIYGTSLGMIKYFINKEKSRNIKYDLFSEDDLNILTSKKKKVDTRDSLFARIDAYLKD